VAVWREPLVWAAEPTAAWPADGPLPLVLAPYPCVHRKRAIDALDRAARAWRIGYTSPSLAGAQAAVRAGLGVTVLSKEMVPPGLTALGTAQGFPELEDTEIALYRAVGGVPPGAERLAEHIVRSLGAQAAS
jgi:DNA-binding transcriptional LysR family regulator